MPLTDLLWVTLAACAAGIVNAIAGGGTLITFPVLIAVGLSPLAANVTSSVALCPGYISGALAQRRDLVGQAPRLRWLLPAGALGGIAGGVLLLLSGERAFARAVPWLILFGALLLAAQEPLRRRLVAHLERHAHAHVAERWAALPIALAAVYGGYFGAGLGVIMLAALAVSLDDTLTRLNAVKQLLSLVINLAAVACFVPAGPVHWQLAGIMAGGALAGGALGGRLVGRIAAATLRRIVVAVGLGVAAIFFARG